MSLPSILLVDDSETILAYERAVLSAHYALRTAKNGREALAEMRASLPDLVLLDLSMPELDGEAVLEIALRDPRLGDVPFVIVSTERQRGEACVLRGAFAYLAKPLSSSSLLAVVERALEHAARKRAEGSLGVLDLEAGGLRVALAIESVRRVLPQVATTPAVIGERRIGRAFELAEGRGCVFSLPDLLGKRHAAPVIDRKLVVLRGAPLVAWSVDDVRGIEVVAAADILDRPDDAWATRTVRVDGASLPLIEPSRLHAPALVADLARFLDSA